MSGTWHEQLDGLNYLVMRTSSINLVNGLFLTKEQAWSLRNLSLKVDSLNLDIPLSNTIYSDEVLKISSTYFMLIDVLLKQQPVSDSLKNAVNEMRVQEADLIKRTLLAAANPAYHGEGCLECHAPPAFFPKGSIAQKDTKPITAVYRKDIDLAHVQGLFGEEGTSLIWELKEAVDSILNNEQRFVFASFRCCLIPAQNAGDPGIIGQSFVTSEWIEYFKSIRELSDKKWLEYKDLFIIPLEDIVKAKLPGIKKKDIDKRIKNAEVVINECRKMDKIEFQLQKENLCVSLSKALNIDDLNGESTRAADERKFMAAMFLLFPGTSRMYTRILESE
ncbi:MAG: hypothetical protein WCM76_09835 [Bacteroidota bacterium]